MYRIVFALLITASLGACAAGEGNLETARQESRACAALGLAPGDDGYSRCVGNLDATYHDDYHPGASS